jgi:tripartite-type tricarboxylate transporter receptor subunit TctC
MIPTTAPLPRRRLIAAAPFLPFATSALAQPDWAPDRPIRLMVGFAPGGSTDVTARILAQAAAPGLGQQIMVENRPGAGGNLASEVVARAAPDGHTLVMGAVGTHAANQALYRNLPFHVVRDFAPVSLVVISYVLVVVHPAVPARTLPELLALARERPGALNAGTAGAGSSQHLAISLVEHLAGVRFTQVAYRGGNPAMQDLIGGRLDLIFAPTVEAIQHVRSGQVRALATGRPGGLPQLPGLAPIIEAVPGFDFRGWLGVFAPAGTPGPAIARLSREIALGVQRPEARERLEALGYEVVGSTAEEFGSFQAAEVPRLAEMVRLSGAAVE